MTKAIALFCILITLLMNRSIASSFRLVTADYPPFSYQENGKTKGMDIEILQTIAKRRKVEFIYDFVPWNRAIDETEKGSADGVFSLVKSPEREKLLFFPTVPFSITQAVFFSYTSFPKTIKSLDDLSDLHVGMELGNTYGGNFDKATNFIKDGAVDHPAMIAKFKAGRTPLFITSNAVGHHLLKTRHIHNYKTHPFIVTEEICYIGISKNSKKAKELLTIIDQELVEMEKSGELKKIRAKYLEK